VPIACLGICPAGDVTAVSSKEDKACHVRTGLSIRRPRGYVVDRETCVLSVAADQIMWNVLVEQAGWHDEEWKGIQLTGTKMGNCLTRRTVAWLHAVSYRVEVVESGKMALSWVGPVASVGRCGCTL
jgi:hypothetical protein